MQTHRFAKIGVACGVLAVGILAVRYADAQTRRMMRRGEVPVPVTPYAVPLATQPYVPATPAPAGAVAVPGSEPMAAAPMHPGSRFIRGSQLIGMTVWDRNHKQLGTIRDFVIDYAGSYPIVYFAMAPDISGWAGGYVIVPFDAFQIGYFGGQMGTTFVLDMTPQNLLHAPQLAVARWNSLPEPQFFTNARQFYRETERTAARPNFEANRQGGVPGFQGNRPGQAPNGQRMRQPNGTQRQGVAPAQPQTETNPGAKGGTERQPNGALQRQPSPPTPAPATPAPQGSEKTPSKPASNPAK